jgi:hypothetical protein
VWNCSGLENSTKPITAMDSSGLSVKALVAKAEMIMSFGPVYFGRRPHFRARTNVPKAPLGSWLG